MQTKSKREQTLAIRNKQYQGTNAIKCNQKQTVAITINHKQTQSVTSNQKQTQSHNNT